MKLSSLPFLGAFGFIFAVFFCGSSLAAGLDFSFHEEAGARLSVTVLDQALQTPVSNAQVVVIDRSSGNLVSQESLTLWGDANLQVANALFQDLIVVAPGYTTFALAGITPGSIQIQLRPISEPRTQIVVGGTVGGWANRESKDLVQMGIVFRSLSLSDLVQFQFQQIISPIRDTVDLMGERQIPSNFAFPDQRVSLPLGSIRINKPQYRLPLFEGSNVRLAVLQGEARSGDLMSLFMGGGKEMDTSALNLFRMKKIGMESLEVRPGLQKNIQATEVLSRSQTVTVRPAPFSASIVVASAVDLEGDLRELVPTDIKSAAEAGKAPRPTRLVTAPAGVGKARVVAAIAMTDRGKRMSGMAQVSSSDTVSFGAFRNAVAFDDFAQAPATVPLSGMSEGLSSLTVQKRLPPKEDGKPQIGHLLAIVYALPGAGSLEVNFAGLGVSVSEVGRYTLSEFELDPAHFNPGHIDGEHQLENLQRFTRSMATYR